jgi:hypothetical protein
MRIELLRKDRQTVRKSEISRNKYKERNNVPINRCTYTKRNILSIETYIKVS